MFEMKIKKNTFMSIKLKKFDENSKNKNNKK